MDFWRLLANFGALLSTRSERAHCLAWSTRANACMTTIKGLCGFGLVDTEEYLGNIPPLL